MAVPHIQTSSSAGQSPSSSGAMMHSSLPMYFIKLLSGSTLLNLAVPWRHCIGCSRQMSLLIEGISAIYLGKKQAVIASSYKDLMGLLIGRMPFRWSDLSVRSGDLSVYTRPSCFARLEPRRFTISCRAPSTPASPSEPRRRVIFANI